jgi:hypothetical protein
MTMTSSRLNKLKEKQREAASEVQLAQTHVAEARLRSKTNTPAPGDAYMVKIGRREVLATDARGQVRLWEAELQAARDRLRSLNGEIRKEERNDKP